MSMSKFRLLAILLLLLGFSAADPICAADGKGKLSGQIEYNRVSPPSAGVKLLTEILDRVRSTPAFAMINKDQSLKKNEQANFTQLGISNYQLAIKPKENRRVAVGGLVPPPPALSSPSPMQISRASGGSALNVLPVNGLRGYHSYKAKSQIAILSDSSDISLSEADQESKLGRSDASANLRARRKETIALLPPNVATGIPLLKLGITQAEAGQSLRDWGSMREEVIGNWTVWSFQKQNSDEPLLQVYMRHGFVEAIRIFDPNLVGHDLGVALGDQIRVLKEQFGEPSFILSEPQPGAGQNYVYPLSQVAFLLSRPNPKAEPEVVSLLIFNVK